MKQRGRPLWIDAFVAVVVLLTGMENLWKWLHDTSSAKSLVIGGLCTLLAIVGLVHVLLARAPKQ